MAVNVSGRQLDTDQLVADIEGALSESGLDPAALTIEVTETTLMNNIEETAHRLTAIKALGVRIAIDDFGTGYSSLAHLQRFPVDALKIDRSFISGLKSNEEGATLIHSLVQLGKALSIETFAEGIEQQHELSLLQRRGLRQRPGLPDRPSPRRRRHRGVPGRSTDGPRRSSARTAREVGDLQLNPVRSRWSRGISPSGRCRWSAIHGAPLRTLLS